MNASLLQKSPGRLPDVKPFDPSVSMPKAAPQVAKRDARKAQLGYGCVDWFQYHVDAEKDNTAH